MTLQEITDALESAQENLENLLERRQELVGLISQYQQAIIAWGQTPNPNGGEPTERRAYYTARRNASQEELATVQESIESTQAQITNLQELQGSYVSASAEAAREGITGEAANLYAQGKLSEEKKAKYLKNGLMAGAIVLALLGAYFLFKKIRKS